MRQALLLRQRALTVLYRGTEKIMRKCGVEHIYAGRYETALVILLVASLKRRRKK